MDDMKKLDIKTPVDVSDISELKSEAYDKIMADPYVRELLKTLGLPVSFVNDNLGLFLRMVEENEPCHNCKCFKDCPKHDTTKGYCAYVDVFESISYKPCKHYLEFKKIADSYVYRDFEDEDVFIDLKDINTTDPQTKSLAGNIARCLKTQKSLYISSKDNLEVVTKLLKWVTNSGLKSQQKVAYINASTLQELVDKYNRFDKDKFEKFKTQIEEVDLLVISGMGNENTSFNLDFYKYSYLMDLFTYREQHHLLTFVSSYYSLEELKDVYGFRNYNLKSKTELLMRKIHEHCDELKFQTLIK